MKKILTFTVAFATAILNIDAQNVNIPDTNFKAYLVADTTINTNSDTEIQVTEAQAFAGSIDVALRNISDLTGIAAFVNITTLQCSGNLLTSIDLSSNTALTDLRCAGNLLTSLNIANGNNANFTRLNTPSNQGLTCIQIDAADTTGYNWTGSNFNFDAGVSFSNNCSAGTGINEVALQNILTVYPNPANMILNIDVATAFANQQNVNIKIVNLLGETVATKQLNIGNNSIDVSHLSSGVYFIYSEKGAVVKFVKA